jgi:hypothetical protein
MEVGNLADEFEIGLLQDPPMNCRAAQRGSAPALCLDLFFAEALHAG